MYSISGIVRHIYRTETNRMERNNIIAFILIFMTLMVWSYLNQPSAEEIQRQQEIQDSIARAENIALEQEVAAESTTSQALTNALPDSLQAVQQAALYGGFAPAYSGTAELVTLENDKIKLDFSSKGAKIVSAQLKDYKSSALIDGEDKGYSPLFMMTDDRNVFNYKINTPGLAAKEINTEDLFFQSTKNGNKVVFRTPTANGVYIEQSYSLSPDSYNVDYDLKLVGMNQHIKGENPIMLEWDNYLNKLEKNSRFEQTYSTVYFREAKDEEVDYCRCVSDATEDYSEDKINWISNVNQFFNTSIIAKDQPFTSGVFETKMLDIEKSKALKYIQSDVGIPFANSSDQTFAMQMYIGPNKFEDLKAYGVELEQVIPYGRSIFGTINRWLIRPFFNFLSQFIGSKGFVIFILIFIIKMALYPLMYKMLHSQAKMAALKPEIAKRTEKFADDPQKKQMETMKIYQEYGASPFGGCFPMIAQMPIWYAMFRFFPASIDFRQESFLWANDLSTYDVFFRHGIDIPFLGDHISLFTLLWAATTLIYTYYNTKHMDMSANPAMKYMQYFMPIMFLGFFNSYAAGLTAYMFFSNLINIAQTVITKKFVFDDEKIKEELKKQKAKPKKKNSFAERLQEQMKQAQAMQEQQQKLKQQQKNKKKGK